MKSGSVTLRQELPAIDTERQNKLWTETRRQELSTDCDKRQELSED